MKRLMILILGLWVNQLTFSQSGEFKEYSNGLIYSANTMRQLTQIVDSLNLKYLSCERDRIYNSKSQAIGHKIILNKGDIKDAYKDIEGNITFEEFKAKYKKAEIYDSVLVVRFEYENYRDEDVIEFSEMNIGSRGELEISKNENLKDFSGKLKSNWVARYTEKSDYSDESLKAFYFDKDFRSVPLADKYQRMIGYADCLIDTTASKFKEDVKQGWVDLPKNWLELSHKRQSKLLDEMRSTRVIGGCSMDTRPREHAINIAMLSASTANWQVFLKAHLDIMNDRFERVSDGSYAWAQRQTYIKELEELNINITDLILGISLRIEDPSKNHYYGNIRRLGRALSETNTRDEIEKEILSIIADDTLDDFNRVIGYYLYSNYIYYTTDESEKTISASKLKSAIETLPTYLAKQLE